MLTEADIFQYRLSLYPDLSIRNQNDLLFSNKNDFITLCEMSQNENTCIATTEIYPTTEHRMHSLPPCNFNYLHNKDQVFSPEGSALNYSCCKNDLWDSYIEKAMAFQETSTVGAVSFIEGVGNCHGMNFEDLDSYRDLLLHADDFTDV